MTQTHLHIRNGDDGNGKMCIYENVYHIVFDKSITESNARSRNLFCFSFFAFRGRSWNRTELEVNSDNATNAIM